MKSSPELIRETVAPRSGGAVPLGDHYLMLVNTAYAGFMTEANFRQFDKSAYDGIAVAFLHAYDVSPVPTVKAMDQQLAEWKTFTHKDIWPWVFLNRIVGKSPEEKNEHADIPYFKRIVGFDLDDKYGAQSEFLLNWRNSLAAARDSKIPGITCDLEFYNYYKEYDIGELARQTGKTPAEAADSLKKLGAKMADSAAEAYPGAMLWFFMTGLTHAGYKTYDGVPYYPSPTYIAIGLLDEIAAKKLPLRLLAGGEGSLGYCPESVSGLQDAIQKRQSELAGLLKRYDGILELGGTITVWSDRSYKKDWLKDGPCKSSVAGSIEELQPFIELLLKTYRYNWIYGLSDGNYHPFSPDNAPRFDAVIQKARTNTNAFRNHS